MALTDTKIRNAKAKASRYRIADARGFSIEISPRSGSEVPGRHWRYRCRLGGKENIFAGGEWYAAPNGETPEEAQERREAVRLNSPEARVAHEGWRADVKAGQHPRVSRRAKALASAASKAQTFDAVATEFIEKRGAGWSDQNRKQLERFLERDISPHIWSLART